jgi:Allene oxide cyclase
VAMRRTTMVGAMALAMALSLGGGLLAGAAAQGDSPAPDITVVERAATDLGIDLGVTGDSLGDLLMFGNDLYDATDTTVAGRDEGTCFRTNPGLSYECTWTNILADGSIVVQGPFYDDLRDSVLAITGGTGVYGGLSHGGLAGTMMLHARDAKGTEFDFVFYDLYDVSTGGGF